MAALGLGFLAGSLTGASGGAASLLKRRFVQGILLTGLAGLLTAASPGLETALLAFALGGFGNGLFVTYQRLLIQSEVPGALPGADLRPDGHAGLLGDGRWRCWPAAR